MNRMKGESFAIACNRSLVKIPPRMGGNLIVFVRIVFSFFFLLLFFLFRRFLFSHLLQDCWADRSETFSDDAANPGLLQRIVG